MNSPAWQAGHRAAFDAPQGAATISPPDGLTNGERSDWISGFLRGVRDSDEWRLMQMIEEGVLE